MKLTCGEILIDKPYLRRQRVRPRHRLVSTQSSGSRCNKSTTEGLIRFPARYEPLVHFVVPCPGAGVNTSSSLGGFGRPREIGNRGRRIVERKIACVLCGGQRLDTFLVSGAIIADLCPECVGMIQVRGCTVLPAVSSAPRPTFTGSGC